MTRCTSGLIDSGVEAGVAYVVSVAILAESIDSVFCSAAKGLMVGGPGEDDRDGDGSLGPHPAPRA